MTADERLSKMLYYIAMGILLCGIVAIGIQKVVGVSLATLLTGLTGPCIVRETLGIYCPGCGGVRSVIYLLSGDILQSLWYHPFTLYAAAMILLVCIVGTVSLLSRGRIPMPKFRRVYFYIGAGIIIAQWLVKLIALLVFATPLIPF